MAGFDPSLIAQQASTLALKHFLGEIDSLLERNEAVVRRGAKGLLEPVLTPSQRTATRRRLEALALSDPDAYSQELRSMITQTSLGEVISLFTSGRGGMGPTETGGRNT